MSDQPILNKTIKLSGEEKKVAKNGGLMIKIKDQDNKGYTIWQKKQDGTDSVAFTNYQQFTLGQWVEIGYVEDAFTTQDGKPATSRTIRNIKAGSAPEGGNTSAQGRTNATAPNFDTQRASIERQVAFKAAIELMVADKLPGVLQDPKGIINAVRSYTNEFTDIIAGKLPARPAPVNQPVEDIPTINYDDEMSGDDDELNELEKTLAGQ